VVRHTPFQTACETLCIAGRKHLNSLDENALNAKNELRQSLLQLLRPPTSKKTRSQADWIAPDALWAMLECDVSEDNDGDFSLVRTGKGPSGKASSRILKKKNSRRSVQVRCLHPY